MAPACHAGAGGQRATALVQTGYRRQDPVDKLHRGAWPTAVDKRWGRWTTPAPSATCPFGIESAAHPQTSGALVRICVPSGWRPLQDPLLLLAPEPLAHDNANSAESRLRAAEARLLWRMQGNSSLIPANWATAITSLRAAGLPAVRTAADDLADASLAFRRRHGPPSGVGLLGWGVGGLSATMALERSPPFGGACVVCAPIGSTSNQLAYLLDFVTLFNVHFPGVLPAECDAAAGECEPDASLDEPTAARAAAVLNGAPHATLRLLRRAGAAVDLVALNSTSRPVPAAMALLREGLAWRAQQRAAFGGRAYDNVHAAFRPGGAGGVEDGAVAKLADRWRFGPTLDPTAAPNGGAAVTLRQHFETSGALRSPLLAVHPHGALLAPFWHQELYSRKAAAHGATSQHTVLVGDAPAGDCELSPALIADALARLGTHIGPRDRTAKGRVQRAERAAALAPTWDAQWRGVAWGDGPVDKRR